MCFFFSFFLFFPEVIVGRAFALIPQNWFRIEIIMLCIFGNLSEQIFIVKNSAICTFSHCRSYVNDTQSVLILKVKKYICFFFFLSLTLNYGLARR